MKSIKNMIVLCLILTTSCLYGQTDSTAWFKNIERTTTLNYKPFTFASFLGTLDSYHHTVSIMNVFSYNGMKLATGMGFDLTKPRFEEGEELPLGNWIGIGFGYSKPLFDSLVNVSAEAWYLPIHAGRAFELIPSLGAATFQGGVTYSPVGWITLGYQPRYFILQQGPDAWVHELWSETTWKHHTLRLTAWNNRGTGLYQTPHWMFDVAITIRVLTTDTLTSSVIVRAHGSPNRDSIRLPDGPDPNFLLFELIIGF